MQTHNRGSCSLDHFVALSKTVHYFAAYEKYWSDHLRFLHFVSYQGTMQPLLFHVDGLFLVYGIYHCSIDVLLLDEKGKTETVD